MEETLKHARGMDIVFFNYLYFYDGIKRKEDEIWKIYFEKLGYTQGQVITPKDWIQSVIKANIPYFAWVYGGIIDFRFLQKIHLRFIDRIMGQDHYFGILLFMQAKNIFILPKKLYNYRIRPNSTCNHEGIENIQRSNIPPYMQDIALAFENNVRAIKEYHFTASYFITFIELHQFLEHHKDTEMSESIRKQLLPFYVEQSLNIPLLKYDPWNLIEKFPMLQGYIQKPNKYQRLAMYSPKLYKRLLPLIRFYRGITNIERNIRRYFKKKKKLKN
ncbi:hypothetical protein CQA53_04725 [Helicobacter didelphidarum]|uniref:Uncharacterized protein n=1 Tax=Helicobacter didelphidarum TaxID=2040648 RepID=A0A3D8IL89_9HELI|nr:hypothetical protein [Helicobacter didelphidarum]RDU66107.1 hypothetical protein CQA53_04725 [Helicobacter didelphidarum]